MSKRNPCPPGHIRIRMGHQSLQYSDTRDEKVDDLNAIFTRARARGYWWMTGTEAGLQPLSRLLASAARRHGFRLHRDRGNWIAVDRKRINPGTWRTGVVWVAAKEDVHGPGQDSTFPWVKFDNPDIGTVAIAAGHYPTKGQTPGRPNFDNNSLYAKKVGQWAIRHGKGKALAFYNGDQNIPDNKFDTFRGQPLTTAGDALGKHPNTGHGPIDVIANYDRDSRVEWVDYQAFSDRRMPLASDHHHLEATADVRLLTA